MFLPQSPEIWVGFIEVWGRKMRGKKLFRADLIPNCNDYIFQTKHFLFFNIFQILYIEVFNVSFKKNLILSVKIESGKQIHYECYGIKRCIT